MIPRSLIAADRRHHTCLRDAKEHCRPLQAARQVPGKRTCDNMSRETGRDRYMQLNREIGRFMLNRSDTCNAISPNTQGRFPPTHKTAPQHYVWAQVLQKVCIKRCTPSPEAQIEARVLDTASTRFAPPPLLRHSACGQEVTPWRKRLSCLVLTAMPGESDCNA